MKSLFAFFTMAMLFIACTPALAALNNENQPMVAEIALGSITADADVFGMYIPKKSKIVDVKLVNGASITASNIDYVQVSLQLGSTVIAEIDTRAAHENGLVANDPKSLNVVAAQSLPASGSYLKATYNEEGAIAMTNAKLIVVYFPL
jgi:hypothetical protein